MLLGEHDTRGDAHIISFKCKSRPRRKVSTDQTGALVSHMTALTPKSGALTGKSRKPRNERFINVDVDLLKKKKKQQLRKFNLPVRVWLCVISKQNDGHCVLIPAVIPLWNWLLKAIFFLMFVLMGIYADRSVCRFPCSVYPQVLDAGH